MSGTRKISATIPADVVERLDSVAGSMGMTRSALLTLLIQETLDSLAAVAGLAAEAAQEGPTKDFARRLRGKSGEHLKSQMDELRRLMEGKDE